VNVNQQGIRAAASLGDVNSDGFPELLVGLQNGGIRWYNGSALSLNESSANTDFAPFPNPVQAGQPLQLDLQPGGILRSNSACNWFDQWGRKLATPTATHQSITAPATPGIYVLRFQTTAGVVATRVVVTPAE
jgi:hypothetical protein